MAKDKKSMFSEKSEDGGNPLEVLQDAIQNAASFVADRTSVAGKAVEDIMTYLGPKIEVSEDYLLCSEDGIHQIPNPVLDERENHEIMALKKRYERLTAPGVIETAFAAVSDALPQQVKDLAQGAGEALSAQQIYSEVMDVIANGFEKIEQLVAAITVSEQDVLSATNRAYSRELVHSVDELCLLRSYDVATVANSKNYQHTIASLIEGGATGAVGFSGIPFNIVLSTLLYYRAVQSIAMFYGYDVKKDASEMVIAAEVFAASFAPRGSSLGGGVAVVGKVMALAEAATVGTVVKRGWLAMAERGGACLLIAQMRALANSTANKALQKAGKAGLEKSILKNVFEQIGKRLPQKVVQRGVPIIGGMIGALFDAGMMGRVLDYADTFYHKRFLIEKELRISALASGVNLNSGFTDEVVDAIVEDGEGDRLPD